MRAIQNKIQRQKNSASLRVSLRSHVIRLVFYGISGQMPLGDDDDDDDDIGSFNTHDDEGNARASTIETD